MIGFDVTPEEVRDEKNEPTNMQISDFTIEIQRNNGTSLDR
jgi:hypothetical protein